MRYAVVASCGVWRSLVARFVRDEEAVGSNPATPTRVIAGRGLRLVNLVGALFRFGCNGIPREGGKVVALPQEEMSGEARCRRDVGIPRGKRHRAWRTAGT
jgi:hypothetical protein